MEWVMNTDLQNVFDQILNVEVKGGLSGDKMVKTMFVFSGMEFDKASSNPWDTDYMVIKSKFEEKGYGDNMPEIVFWNLRDSRATMVPKEHKGVAMVSGFLKNMMKFFMEGKDMQLDPKLVIGHRKEGKRGLGSGLGSGNLGMTAMITYVNGLVFYVTLLLKGSLS